MVFLVERAAIHSQAIMINLTNVLAVQKEQRDTNKVRSKTALKSNNTCCIISSSMGKFITIAHY